MARGPCRTRFFFFDATGPACPPSPLLPSAPHSLTCLQIKFNDAVGNKDYASSSWMDGVEPPTPTSLMAPLPDVAALKPGSMKKSLFHGSALGKQARQKLQCALH
jgi:hypothetical protein